MSYETHTWESGETITAEKLNHIEDGIANSSGSEPLIFTITDEEISCPNNPLSTTVKHTYSHSWQEIYDALVSGKQVVCKNVYDDDNSHGVEIYHFDSIFYDTEVSADFGTSYVGLITQNVLDDFTIDKWGVVGWIVRFSDATSKEFIEPCGME